MSLIHHILTLVPGKTKMRYKQKLTRAKVAGASKRFSEAINTCKSRLAIDLGANQGKYTKILAENFDRVIAFEPNPDAFLILEKNLSHYSNVELHQLAVGTECGTSTMFLRDMYESNPASYSEGTTLFESKENVDPTKSIHVKMVDITRFIEELGQEVGIIKVDIEGAEVPVLEALLDSTSLQKIEYIFVETHEFKIPELYKRTIALRKRVKNIIKPKIDMDWG